MQIGRRTPAQKIKTHPPRRRVGRTTPSSKIKMCAFSNINASPKFKKISIELFKCPSSKNNISPSSSKESLTTSPLWATPRESTSLSATYSSSATTNTKPSGSLSTSPSTKGFYYLDSTKTTSPSPTSTSLSSKTSSNDKIINYMPTSTAPSAWMNQYGYLNGL